MKIVCLLILMLPVLPALAQQADSTARIEEVTIIGDYSPVVKEAFKIRTNPVIQQEEVRMPALNYAIKSSPVYHKMSFPQLRPEELERRQAEDYRKNFLKLGFGNYTTPYIEFFANMQKYMMFNAAVDFASTSIWTIFLRAGCSNRPDNNLHEARRHLFQIR